MVIVAAMANTCGRTGEHRATRASVFISSLRGTKTATLR